MRRLPPLPTIQDIIRIYGLTARKKLSQNFLLDLNLCDKIVRKAGIVEGGLVVEVGPGPAGITRSILNAGASKVVVIEKDSRFLPSLQILAEASDSRLHVIHGDILNYSLQPYGSSQYSSNWDDEVPAINIIGNLPFSVSTPLVIQWLNDISTRSNIWAHGRAAMTLTFQKEVAQRIIAAPRSEFRCRLSVMCQYLCHVNHKFTIPGKAFVPVPKVDVGVVRLVPRKEPLIHQPFELVEKVNRILFNMPNKFCLRALRCLFPPTREDLVCQLLETSSIDPQRRPFELSIEDIGNICDAYAQIIHEEEGVINYDFRSSKSAKSLRHRTLTITSDLEQRLLMDADS